MSRPFAHLHCHTHYSLLDGANRIPEVVKKVKGAGMNSLAITDHGNLYGAMEFYNTCRAQEINPILGFEAYIAPGKRTDRSGASRMKEASFHLTLLAMNRKGFENLMHMSSIAYLEGFYYKPRIDKELLEEFNEGIICLSGCAAGELSQLLLSDKMTEARELTAWYERVFGDRFYMEIQNAGFDIQRECAEGTIDLANTMGLPLVATNDAHYLNQSDAHAHDILLCVNTRTNIHDEKRMKMDSDELFVRTPEEMYAAFPGHEAAVKRSQEIADRVDIQLEKNPQHYPVFRPPEEKTDIDYLRELCLKGITWRYGDAANEKHFERLDYELEVIKKMGYASYFLIVWDFVRFAGEQGIPCQARGSACGAIVAYVLGFSHVCPLEYDLLFERFLDPSRTEPPDIDIDFCRDRRQMVIDYTKETYGEFNVAQIGTFGTLKAKNAIRDVSRALALDLKRVDEICKMIPETLNIKLKDALKESAELREAYENDPQVTQMLDLAISIEGLARSAGTHAAGVVVADEPISRYIPLQRITGKTDIITQWDGPTVEEVGLLKMDFLGLRNLTILDKAIQNVKKHHPDQQDIDPLKFPLDDPETFALLQRGETKGIFQLESGGMRDLLQKMKPDSFLDIIATSALYRPGPLEGGMVMTYVEVKHGRMPIPKVHPIVDEILDETYGVMVYQEQVMRILNRVGGIDLPAAYRCIKAISKKKEKTIASFHQEYIDGAVERGVEQKIAEELFELIKKFAGYGFNKSHSTAYGAVAYQTAYLKAHYPKEFMAALLSCGMESSERINEHVDDCRRMNLKVLPPDINRAQVEFDISGDDVVFGLGAIKGVGEVALQKVVEEREANGPYRNIFDLTERIDPKVLNKSALEILIKAGALDSLGQNRAQLFVAAERAVQSAIKVHKDRAIGQKSLFGDMADSVSGDDGQDDVTLPDTPEWNHSQQLAFEKEVFGFYLTSHPLTEHSERVGKFRSHTIHQIGDLEEGEEVLISGMVSSIKKSTSKKPNRNGHTKFANFDFEDETGTVRCIIWPEEFSRQGDKLESEDILYVQGRVDRRGREPNVVVNKLLTLEEAEKQFTRQIAIKIQKGLHPDDCLPRIREILQRYPGRTSVMLYIDSHDDASGEWTRYVLSLPASIQVSGSESLQRDLEGLLGNGAVQLIAHQFKSAKATRNGHAMAGTMG